MSYIDENNILSGPELTEDFTTVSLGKFCFDTLLSHSKIPQHAPLMVEADTKRECGVSEFLSLSVQAARGFQEEGVKSGDVVCFFGDNCVDICAAAIGVLFIGGIMCPLDPTMKRFELQQMIQIIQPKLIVCDSCTVPNVKKAVRELELGVTIITLQNTKGEKTLKSMMVGTSAEDFTPVDADDMDDVALIVGSSGSTGLPKAVCLTHKNMMFQIILGNGVTRLFPNQAFLHTSFFFWISGVVVLFTSIALHIRRVLIKDVSEVPIMEAIRDYKPILTMISPALLGNIVNHPDFQKYDLSSMKVIIAVGSPTPVATQELIRRCWNSQMLMASPYGLTELGGAYLSHMPSPNPIPQEIGTPMLGCLLKIMDPVTKKNQPSGEEGEICAKSPALMKYYLNNPEATAEAIDDDGWFHTGDLGYFNSNGVVYFTGRIKELLKLDNHQIAPAEIEAVIKAVPGVYDVGVAGIKISEDSCHPMALVVKLKGSEVSEEEIIKSVNENLSDFKQLRAGVCFVDSIPRTATGKIKRSLLLDLARELYLQEDGSFI